MYLGKKEYSHQDKQERFNGNYLGNSICVSKRLKCLVALYLEKSKPTCTWLLLGGSLGHQEEVATSQMICSPRVWGKKGCTSVSYAPNLGCHERDHQSKTFLKDLPTWATWRNNGALQRQSPYYEPMVKPSTPVGKYAMSIREIQVRDRWQAKGL